MRRKLGHSCLKEPQRWTHVFYFSRTVWAVWPLRRSESKTTPKRESPNRSILPCAFDGEELLILKLVRCYFASFAQPSSLGWADAIRHATDEAPDRAGETLRQTLNAVQAMRIARTSCFRFANPNCRSCSQGVTAHERQFMACVTSARKGDLMQADRHAFLLCEGNDTSAFLSALSDFTPG